jgi:PAS domain S-box-containing protein
MVDYEEIFEKLPDGITLHSPADGAILDTNERFCEMLGYRREELLEMGFDELHVEEPPYTAARAEQFIRKAATEGPQTFEWVDETKTGDRLPVEVHLTQTVIRGEDRILAVVRDITERKRRERRLERVRERMEFALDATDSIIWVLDVPTRESTEYGPIERLLGMEPAGFPEFLEGVVHPADRAEVGRVFEAVEAGNSTIFDVEFRTAPGSGGRDWIASRGFLQEGDAGESPTLIGLATDISDRKAREEELERQNERLEDFASIVSHDLRNPLSTAGDWLALAREEGDQEYFDNIEQAHERMWALIDDLLRLAREGEPIDEGEPVDLDSVAEACWQNVDTGDASLEHRTDLTIEADRSRLRQLFENLMRNAVEHGGEDVTLDVGRLEHGFYVADDGPGIPPDRRDVVFESGYSTTGSGTGFGLTIVAQIATDHDWDIDLCESPAGGARFEITGVEVRS